MKHHHLKTEIYLNKNQLRTICVITKYSSQGRLHDEVVYSSIYRFMYVIKIVKYC